MKNLLNIFNRVFCCACCILYFSAHAQQSRSFKTAWRNPLKQNVFVENKGQCDDNSNGGRGKVLFSASQDVDIFWNPGGLTYRATEHYIPERVKAEALKSSHEEMKEAFQENMKIKYHYLDMEWIGSNPNVAVSAEEKVSNYFTFANLADESGKSGIKALAYKKITYKNMYPGIDVEYTLPEGGGVKYSLIVHPGADLRAVKIQYSGASKIKLNEQGQLEVDADRCGNYLEHRPETFYQDGAPVKSSFTLQNSIIGFDIPEYDKTKTLVIDPWMKPISWPAGSNTDPTVIACKNTGYDVCYDLAGNVWVYGGSDPLYLSKYDPAGTLLWTFQVPFPAWDEVGDFDVNKTSGTAYISEGDDATAYTQGLIASVVKVNSAGIQTGKFNNGVAGRNEEITRIRLDCNGKLYMTGGGVQNGVGMYQAASMDTNLTAMTGAHIVASPNGDHDINLMALDPTGNFMYENLNYPAPFSMDYTDNNTLYKLPIPGFLPRTWMNPGPIYNFVEMGSIPYGGRADAGSSPSRINTFNGMVCGNAFLYTCDGATLKQWNKGTGTMIKQVTTGGKMYWSGGLDLDLCENVYVSVGNAVKEYDANLNFITSYAMPDTSIYDLKFDKLRNKIYTTGNGYVRTTDLTPLVIPQLTATFTPTSPGCNAQCNGTASATITSSNCISVASFSYKWMPGGETTASISGLCPGTYTVIATAFVTCARNIGDTAFVTIPNAGGNQVTASTSSTPDQCSSGSGTASVININGGTAPYTYQWSSGATSSTATGLSSGNYTITVTDNVGCSNTQTVTVVPTGGLSVSTSSNPGCAIATATVTPNGGTSPYSYLWNNGQTTSAAINLTAGTYTATITDVNGCIGTQTVDVTVLALPTAQIVPSSPCLGSSATLADGSVSSQNDPITVWSWNMPGATPSASSNPNVSTIYNTAGTHTVTLIVTTQAGCKDTIDQQVLVYNPPIANFVGSDSGCAPLCVVNFNSGSSSSTDGNITVWDWSFPGGNPPVSNAQNPTPICYNTPGNYGASLIVTTQYGCKDTVTITPLVKVYPWPDADFCVTPSLQQPATNPVFSFCNLWTPNPGVTDWIWDFGDGNTDTVNMTPTHSYSATATANDFYTYDVCLHVKTQFGCWDTTCKTVELIPEYEFYIPNTFTPNSDNLNEFFYGKCRGVKEYNIWVFDRWGNQVWDCHKADQNAKWDSDALPRQEGLSSFCQWDGKVQSGGADMSGDSRQLVQEDVYVWKVKLTDIFDKTHNYIGHVNIVR